MTPPTELQFSQGSLQDYHDCPRRFYYRYLRQLAWPALEAEPALENERHLRAGAAFHQLVHQALAGIPQELLAARATAEPLAGWWANFQAHNPIPPGLRLLPEVQVQAELDGARLVARFDLLALDADGRAMIFDWKTSRRRPPRPVLAARLQTRVYPLTLALAGVQFNAGQPIAPENIRMLYWFAGEPERPEIFEYSAAALAADQAEIAGLIADIRPRSAPDDFPLTPDHQACRFCVYRSRCDRGVTAGDSADAGELDDRELAESFDFDQIDEIRF